MGAAHQDAREGRENPWKVGLEPDLEPVGKTPAMISLYLAQATRRMQRLGYGADSAALGRVVGSVRADDFISTKKRHWGCMWPQSF